MKTLIIALLTLTSTMSFAQITTTWKGGTPGKESSWDEPKNWSNHHVPDEFSLVIIKNQNSGHNAQPVIDSEVEVASVEIWSSASLTISDKGQLVVDGTYTYSEGIRIYGGSLVNTGIVHLNNLDVMITADFLKNVRNTGQLFLDGQPLEPQKPKQFAFSKSDIPDQ